MFKISFEQEGELTTPFETLNTPGDFYLEAGEYKFRFDKFDKGGSPLPDYAYRHETWFIATNKRLMFPNGTRIYWESPARFGPALMALKGDVVLKAGKYVAHLPHNSKMPFQIVPGPINTQARPIDAPWHPNKS